MNKARLATNLRNQSLSLVVQTKHTSNITRARLTFGLTLSQYAVNFDQVLQKVLNVNSLLLLTRLIADNLFINKIYWHLIRQSCIVGTVLDFQHLAINILATNKMVPQDGIKFIHVRKQV